MAWAATEGRACLRETVTNPVSRRPLPFPDGRKGFPHATEFGFEGRVGYLWTVKILFIHGLASSGAYKMATMLRQLVRPLPGTGQEDRYGKEYETGNLDRYRDEDWTGQKERYCADDGSGTENRHGVEDGAVLNRHPDVIAPDFPVDPDEMGPMLEAICTDENPDLVVGLSLGGFWAQKLKGRRKVLVNPSFHISGLLETMVGEVSYLSPRQDGAKTFTVTEEIVRRYKELEYSQFLDITPEEAAITLGLFADRDERVRCSEEFAAAYPGRAVSYPGSHLPTYPEMKFHIVPAIERFLLDTAAL